MWLYSVLFCIPWIFLSQKTATLQHLTMTAKYVSGIPLQYSGQSIIITICNRYPWGGCTCTFQMLWHKKYFAMQTIKSCLKQCCGFPCHGTPPDPIWYPTPTPCSFSWWLTRVQPNMWLYSVLFCIESRNCDVYEGSRGGEWCRNVGETMLTIGTNTTNRNQKGAWRNYRSNTETDPRKVYRGEE